MTASSRSGWTATPMTSSTGCRRGATTTCSVRTQTEISLVYYPNKGGLTDRVFRIRTERSSATSLPEGRTSHNITNVEVIERRGDLVDIRFNWHTMYFRYNTVDPYYGTSFYTIDFSGDSPLIRRKTVVLKNDYIHHVVDIYHF